MTEAPTLRINPDIDVDAAAAHYAEHTWVQIPNFFPDEVAEQIGKILETTIPWSLVYWGPEGRPVYKPLAEMRAMPPQQYAALVADLHKRSGDAYGFMHMNYRMITAYIEGTEPGHPIHQVTEFLNSPEYLDFGRKVTSDAAIRKADGQATLYRPGDYIGWHVDQDIETIERSAAFTLGFTRHWRPDWGGQLAFHDEKNDVSRALQPAWNTLTLFKTPQPHSVIPIAPYAQLPRVSIIGWLRRDP